MRKMSELWIIVPVLLIYAIAGTSYHAGIYDGQRGLYPDTAIITAIDYDADIVTVTDVAGIVRQFCGCEDYCIGDLVRMMMHDEGTSHSILDDTIVVAWYAGTLEQFQNVLTCGENDR